MLTLSGTSRKQGAHSDTHPSLHGTPASQATSFFLKARVTSRVTKRPPRPSASVPVQDFTQTEGPRATTLDHLPCTHTTLDRTGGGEPGQPGPRGPLTNSQPGGPRLGACWGRAPAHLQSRAQSHGQPAPSSASCPETQLSQL